MPTNLPLPAHSRQRAIADDFVVAELARLGTAPGKTPATRELEQLRDNARRFINRCFPTLVTLLRANGRAREFAADLADYLAPLPIAVPLAEALIAETEVECAENALQARVLAGDHSGPTLSALRDRIREHRDALDIAHATLGRELAQHAGIAA